MNHKNPTETQHTTCVLAGVPGTVQSYVLSRVLCSHQVSENKMFRLNESLEINTKKLCNLNESSDKSAKSLQVTDGKKGSLGVHTSSHNALRIAFAAQGIIGGKYQFEAPPAAIRFESFSYHR